ncbi:MAG: rhomboid family intramembrane serine protease [Kiritimatiellia bacterium]|nr:rhomboid family intramembrane serine protease [Kiritimatiellia bacterium]
MRLRHIDNPLSEIRRDWWRFLLFYAGIALFVPVWFNAAKRGMLSAEYSHITLTPILAAVVYLWTKQKGADAAAERSSWILWAAGLGLHAAGAWLDKTSLSQLGFPLLLTGSAGALFGRNQGKRLLVPSLLLFLGLGLPSELMLTAFRGPLRLFAAGFAFDSIGTIMPQLAPYTLKGSVIVTLLDTFDVAAECSSVRSLTALLILGTLVGWYCRLSLRARCSYAIGLVIAGIASKVLQICLTFGTVVGSEQLFTLQGAHTFWDLSIFTLLVLCSPLIARAANKWHPRLSIVRAVALVLVLSYAVSLTLMAQQSATTPLVVEFGTHLTGTVLVDGSRVPSAILPLATPGKEGLLRWSWLFTSGLFHWDMAHLLTNLLVLLLLGEALGNRLGRWMLVVLLGGQATACAAGLLVLPPGATAATTVFVGASGAVSALFGAFLVAMLTGGRKLAGIILCAVYSAGIALNAATIRPGLSFSVSSHFAALAFGLLAGLLILRLRANIRDGQA